MDISIIGAGHVGLVTAACFADLGNNVICMDSDGKKIENLKTGILPFYEPELEEMVHRNFQNKRLRFTHSIKEAVDNSLVIFITVGTPSKLNGEANMVYVEKVATKVATCMQDYRLIVEKSTVPVHTGEWIKHTININLNKTINFDVCSNPEFLSEGNAINDFIHPDRIVLGVESKKSEKILKSLYEPFAAPIIITDINSAELIKHASNSFLATKISFINTIAEICEKTNADIDKVAKGLGLDTRIGDKFLNAGIGYGGSCLPKDIKAFIHIAKSKGVNFNILKAVSEVNKRQQSNFLQKVRKNLWVLEGKNIAVWGFSFKPGTDDIREAPALGIIEKLLQEMANIKVYDPQVKKIEKEIFKSINFELSPYDAVMECDCLLILTEWNEFKKIDLHKVKSLLKQPLIIDGRNLYDLEKMRALGFKYISTGRPSVNSEKINIVHHINMKKDS